MRYCIAMLASVLAWNPLHAAGTADAPLVRKAPERAASFDWSGFYAGGHVGYARGDLTNTLSDPAPSVLRHRFGSLYGGVQGGYNHVFPTGLLVGLEGDITFPDFLEDGAMARRATAFGTNVTDQLDFIATLGARFGYANGRFMVYGTGGLAWSQTRFLETPGVVLEQDKILRQRAGYALGAGAEVALTSNWAARVEYQYERLGAASGLFPSGVGGSASTISSAPATPSSPRGGTCGQALATTGMCMANSP
jgi:high affinity Mn2+ porin